MLYDFYMIESEYRMIDVNLILSMNAFAVMFVADFEAERLFVRGRGIKKVVVKLVVCLFVLKCWFIIEDECCHHTFCLSTAMLVSICSWVQRFLHFHFCYRFPFPIVPLFSTYINLYLIHFQSFIHFIFILPEPLHHLTELLNLHFVWMPIKFLAMLPFD